MSSESREVLHDQEAHPTHGTGTYWIIGVILMVVTGLEVVAYLLEDTLGRFTAEVILALSAVKFALVVMFYMHLKYDSKIFTGVFLFPAALGTLVIGGLTILYHVLHPLR
jgi:cytochrome c oxidase subunit 4